MSFLRKLKHQQPSQPYHAILASPVREPHPAKTAPAIGSRSVW